MRAQAQGRIQGGSRRMIPLAIAIALLLILCSLVVIVMTKAERRSYVYPLDDTYITMSISRHLAESGVWGVTAREFTSSSSTPAYGLLLAGCYRLTGVNEWWPLALATISAALALVAASAWLRSLPGWAETGGLLAVGALVPMHVMALTGMEHCLHICLSLIFLRLAAAVLETGENGRSLVILAPAMILVRFESLFLIGICAGLLLLRRRWWLGAAILISGSAAMAAVSAVSLAHGWAWLPNSLLLKSSLGAAQGSRGPLMALGLRALKEGAEAPHVAGLAGALVAVLIVTRDAASIWDRRRIALAVTLLATLAHLQYARVGWLYRYDAYLVAMGLCALLAATPLVQFRPSAPLPVVLGCAVALAFLMPRAVHACIDVIQASYNIYEQQYQMARFLGRYYPEAVVAANDIGWISYANDIRLLDLTGLANREVLEAKRAGRYTTDVIDVEARRRGVAIALLYDSWFSNLPRVEFGGPPLPRQWIRAGRWQVRDNVMLGDSTVSFYAVRPEEAEGLRQCLREFAPSLPGSVAWLQN